MIKNILILLVVAIVLNVILRKVIKAMNGENAGLSSIFARLLKLKVLFRDGFNVDEKAHFSHEELRKFSLGNLYVYQQQGTLNTLATGVQASMRKVILKEYFDIHDRDSAIGLLQWLAHAPSQQMFHYAYAAFMQGGGKAGADWLYELEELKEHPDFREDCLEKLDQLETQYTAIIKDGVAASKEDIGRLGVLAWDAGRLNFIARLCMEQQYISREECMECIDAAYEMTKEAYSGWADYAHSYVLGRTLSMGTTNMTELMKQLLENPKSPWTYVKW